MEFGAEFYTRVLRLMRSGKADATQELRLLHQAVLDEYAAKGWTYRWGQEEAPAARPEPDATSRLHNREKLVAPPRKSPAALAAPARPAPASSPLAAKRPSPAASPATSPARLKTEAQRPAAPPAPPAAPAVSEDKTPKFLTLNRCKGCGTAEEAPSNVLVQCNDCSEYYHQKCSSPPISNEEAADPRWMYTCAGCEGASVAAEPAAKKRRPELTEDSLFSRVEKATAEEKASGGKALSSSSLSSMAADFFAKHKGAKAAGAKSPPVLKSPAGPAPLALSRVQQADKKLADLKKKLKKI